MFKIMKQCPLLRIRNNLSHFTQKQKRLPRNTTQNITRKLNPILGDQSAHSPKARLNLFRTELIHAYLYPSQTAS